MRSILKGDYSKDWQPLYKPQPAEPYVAPKPVPTPTPALSASSASLLSLWLMLGVMLIVAGFWVYSKGWLSRKEPPPLYMADTDGIIAPALSPIASVDDDKPLPMPMAAATVGAFVCTAGAGAQAGMVTAMTTDRGSMIANNGSTSVTCTTSMGGGLLIPPETVVTVAR